MRDMPEIANPWLDLPSRAPFVLPADRLAVEVFNEKLRSDHPHRIDLCAVPEPFLGPRSAQIVVLLLNPGIGDDTEFRASLRQCYATREGSPAHPYVGSSVRWWRTLVAPLTQLVPLDVVAQRLLSIEFFPYRSKSFGCGHVRLPSQQYSFDLVRDAIDRQATIVIARGEQLWRGAVPELAAYPKLFRLSNPRTASLSEANVREGGHASILAAIRS